MHHAQLLFSKLIDANDIQAVTRFGITEKHLSTEGERQTLRFLLDYSEKNRNQAPSYAEVTAQCPDFVYTPEVGDSYEYLAREIKKHSAKVQFMELVNGVRDEKSGKLLKDGIAEQFEKVGQKDIFSLFEWLQSEVESIKLNTNTSSKIGTNIKTDAEQFLAEYQRRKAGESFKIWKSKFPSINEHVGGYLSGNMYTWHGRSGRGKSVFVGEEGIESGMQGANVLIWAMEMSRFEWMARAYSSLSARAGVVNANIDGVDYEAGFENRALLSGKLSEEFEQGFEQFLGTLNELIPGNITLRAAVDVDFFNRGVKQLEADILATKADVVVVDPIYLMDYEANTSKVAGGDVANTSKRIRRIAGLTGAVIHVITQADEVKDDRDDEGNRELRPPKRAEIKKTKAVLEDAANVFGIDTLDGAGIIEIGKGRNGGEGTQVEVLYLPNYGIVREVETGEAAVSQFDF
jgi:replicative DNA helicase